MIKLIAPKYPIKGSIILPGSKSISNRLLILRAVHNSKVKFINLSDADDTLILAKALGKIQESKSATIDIHHAGTDMRFLTAYLSAKEGEWILSGSDRMKKRPIGELVRALKAIGADISYLEQDGFPPLKIKGKKLAGGKIEIDGSISSQFISALLLIGTTFSNGLELVLKGEIVSRPYIKMTIELLKQFGIKFDFSKDRIVLKEITSNIKHQTLNIESDWSAASYWYSIIALQNGSEMTLENLSQNSLQADSILPKIYDKLGVRTEFTSKGIKLTNKPIEISEFKYDFTDCPDIAQTLAATCVGIGIKAELSGLQTLKHKETDRISALKTELEKFGAIVQTTNNSLTILHTTTLRTPNAELRTYQDHRMAMSLAPLSLKVPELKIADPEVVDKSYSAFWDDLELCGFDVS